MRAISRLPPDARIVALVGFAGDAGLVGDAGFVDGAGLVERTLEIASAVAEQRRGRTLLVGWGEAGRALDARLGAGGDEGLTDVLAGRARLTDVARRTPDHRFLYVPTGRSEEPLPPSRLRQLFERVRMAGGTLLLPVAEDRSQLPAEWFDAELPLQSSSEPALVPGRWRRHRVVQGVPIGWVMLALVIIAGLVGGWWVLARLATDREASDGVGAYATATAEGEAGAVGEAAAEGAAGAVPSDAVAPALGYSVLIASYTSLEEARRRAGGLAVPGLLLFVSPTPIGGTLYYRLFAGALETRQAARELMHALVERGVKESASDWDLRPASLSFRVAVHEDSASARAAQRELALSGVPTYVLPLAAAGDITYQVYAGAYERPEAAVAMGSLLQQAGRDVELVPRRGGPR
ncbi:MAG: SPOR domain-containing protein [Gemmatimonadota bacterium]